MRHDTSVLGRFNMVTISIFEEKRCISSSKYYKETGVKEQPSGRLLACAKAFFSEIRQKEINLFSPRLNIFTFRDQRHSQTTSVLSVFGIWNRSFRSLQKLKIEMYNFSSLFCHNCKKHVAKNEILLLF